MMISAAVITSAGASVASMSSTRRSLADEEQERPVGHALQVAGHSQAGVPQRRHDGSRQEAQEEQRQAEDEQEPCMPGRLDPHHPGT